MDWLQSLLSETYTLNQIFIPVSLSNKIVPLFFPATLIRGPGRDKG